MTRVLVAGGAGFIGSHLCDRLLADGYEVVAVDNLISGDLKNLSHLVDNPHFQFIREDITSSPDQLQKLGVFSLILHFASPASPNPESPVSYMAHPIETLMVNSLGTKNLLDLATTQNAQIVLASTSEIYGNPLIHPQKENYLGNVSSTGVRSCYDEGKRFMEALAFAYFRKHNTKIKIIRIFNTYGPRMRLDDGRFIPNLLNSYLSNTPFAIYGTGETTRSFSYISDLIAGIVKVIQTDKMLGEVINLGNPQELTLNQAINIFESIVKSKLITKTLPSKPDDPARRNPDISKAKEILAWEPQVSFGEGLQKTLTFYKTTI